MGFRYLLLGLGLSLLWAGFSPVVMALPRLAPLTVARVQITDAPVSRPAIAPSSALSSPAPADWVAQGRSHYAAGQFNAAIAAWQQAEALYAAQDTPLHRAEVLNYLSLAHQQMANWAAAEQAIAASLALLQNLADDSAARPILAQALNTQGSLYFQRGQTELALDTWRQATRQYAAAQQPAGWVGSQINQARAQQSLGLFFQVQHTLAEVERSLPTLPDAELRLMGWQQLGEMQRLAGNLEASRQTLQEGLAIARQTHASAVGPLLLSLGNTARIQGDAAAALAAYQEATEVATTPLDRLRAQLNHLSLRVAIGDRPGAMALVEAIQPALSDLPASRHHIYAQIHFAQSLLSLGDAESIRRAAQELAIAIQHARTLGDRRGESYALGYLGRGYELTRQWQEAQQVTEQALLLAQSIQAADLAYQWHWQQGRVFLVQNHPDAAQTAYAAAFETLQSIRRDLVATHADIQFSFRDSVEPIYRGFVALLLRPPSAGTAPPAANLEQARQVIEALQVAELDNFFRTACLDSQTVAIDQIEQTDAAIVYPIILSDRLDIILSLPHQPLRHYSTPIPQMELEATLAQLRQQLERPLTSPESRTLGQQVYGWLIRPLAPALNSATIHTLVFVLDGALRNIPIAALHNGHQYLVEQYGLALAPSLRLLDPRPLAQTRLTTLAAGLSESRLGFSALQSVERELRQIQAQVPSQLLLNEAFTSTSLQTQLADSDFSIVHLATHGQFSSNAADTFILAWDKPIRVTELGQLLRASDTVRSNPIELLVLSACETAAGDTRAALGLAGFAVQAGARSTVASLWSVDDASGAEWVNQFYTALTQDGLSKVDALRQAQLHLLHDPTYRHPRYWASFVLVGNWL